MSQGRLLRQQQFDPAEKLVKPRYNPHLQQFVDVVTANQNGVVTPNGIERLRGQNLKFNFENSPEGVFFVVADSMEKRVATFAKHSVSGDFQHTGLAAATYRLELRKTYGTQHLPASYWYAKPAANRRVIKSNTFSFSVSTIYDLLNPNINW